MIQPQVITTRRIPCDQHGKPLTLAGRILRRAKTLLGMCMFTFSTLLPMKFSPLARNGYALGTLAASATIQAPFNGADRGQTLVWVMFTVKATGNYPANGDTLDLSVVAPPGCGGLPLQTWIASQPLSGNTHSGYTYAYIVGTTQKNGKVQVLAASGAGNILADIGAQTPYPTAISSDNIVGECAFVFGS